MQWASVHTSAAATLRCSASFICSMVMCRTKRISAVFSPTAVKNGSSFHAARSPGHDIVSSLMRYASCRCTLGGVA